MHPARRFRDGEADVLVATDAIAMGLNLPIAEVLFYKLDKFNGNPIGIQLPEKVELAVTYTEPGARGNTASGAVTKHARLETGLEIRVPFFVEEGEKVKV